MKIAIISTSDARGGAAVVSLRLMKALRALGHDAYMIVGHKDSTDPHVHAVEARWRLKESFLAEHLRIFLANGLNRDSLFKVSIATDGLPLSKHPLVKEADAVILGWVNQGLLSLKEIGRIASMKPTLWVMHDMWNLTAVCHYSEQCMQYTESPGCRRCPLLNRGHNIPTPLSAAAWRRKKKLYSTAPLHFAAVSSFLAGRCRQSSLMKDCRVTVIPNAFPVEEFYTEPRRTRKELGLPEDKKIILMGAARLDDHVKGLPLAVEALNHVHEQGHDDAVAVFFGDIRNPHALDGLRLPHITLGSITDPATIRELYAHATVLLSSSIYETLPGTLIEAQAAGCTPVTFDRGDQTDIIRNPELGYTAPPFDTAALAAAIRKGLDTPCCAQALRQSVMDKFSAQAVAQRYVDYFTYNLGVSKQ